MSNHEPKIRIRNAVEDIQRQAQTISADFTTGVYTLELHLNAPKIPQRLPQNEKMEELTLEAVQVEAVRDWITELAKQVRAGRYESA